MEKDKLLHITNCARKMADSLEGEEDVVILSATIVYMCATIAAIEYPIVREKFIKTMKLLLSKIEEGQSPESFIVEMFGLC